MFQIRPSIPLAGRGRYIGSSGYNRLTGIRIAANRLLGSETSVIWKLVERVCLAIFALILIR